MKRSYRFDTEVSDVVFAETSRQNFRTMMRLHLQQRMAELEKAILEDWDAAHRDQMKEFASALNTSLADAARRRQYPPSRPQGDESSDG